jgi:hypothetical protein
VRIYIRIVSEGISPALLQWKGIEATEKLAQAPNSKMVFIGNSRASLPIMLSADAMGLGGGTAGGAAGGAAAADKAGGIESDKVPPRSPIMKEENKYM